MRIFILEDDVNCDSIIAWLRNNNQIVKVARNLEDASFYLEYEEEYKRYDKFILDASLPGALVYHADGVEKAYNGALNGIDFMMECFPRLGIELDKIAILTAFEMIAKEYLQQKSLDSSINIINKNDNDLVRRLLEFLDF